MLLAKSKPVEPPELLFLAPYPLPPKASSVSSKLTILLLLLPLPLLLPLLLGAAKAAKDDPSLPAVTAEVLLLRGEDGVFGVLTEETELFGLGSYGSDERNFSCS